MTGELHLILKRVSIQNPITNYANLPKLALVDSPPRSMTSLTLGSLLGFPVTGMISFMLKRHWAQLDSCWLAPTCEYHYHTLGASLSYWSLLWFIVVLAGQQCQMSPSRDSLHSTFQYYETQSSGKSCPLIATCMNRNTQSSNLKN